VSFAVWYVIRVPYLRVLVAAGRPFVGWVPAQPRATDLFLERDLPDHPVHGRGFFEYVRRTLVQRGELTPQDLAAADAAVRARQESDPVYRRVVATIRTEMDRVRSETLGVMVVTAPQAPLKRLKGMSLHFNLVIYLSLFFAGLPGSLLRRARAALWGLPFLLAFQLLFLEYSVWSALRTPDVPGAQGENQAFFEGRVRDVYVFLVSLVPVLIWLYHRVRLAGPSKQTVPNADSV
jgi:hypothetical protein